MRRLLLVVLFAVVALGALMDATVHRDHVGQPVPMWRSDGDATVPTLVGTSGSPEAFDGRYSLYVAVREVAPGATVLVDQRIRAAEMSEVFLRTIGASADVRVADLRETAGASERSESLALEASRFTGVYRHGHWDLRVAGGPVRTLLVVESDGGKLLLDARLVPGAQIDDTPLTPAAVVTSARSVDRAPTLLRAVLAESFALFLLLLAGGLLLPRERWRRTLRMSIALPVGLALHATLALLLLPGIWGLAATVAVSVIVSTASVRVPIGWRRDDVGPLAIAAIGLLTIVGWARWASFLFLTPDSRDYWAAGALLADGRMSISLLEVKRGLALPSLHAIGFAFGVEGLQALGAVLLLVGASLVVMTHNRIGLTTSVVPLLLAVPVILSPQLRTMAAYLNTHIVVAVLLLVLILLLGAGAHNGMQTALLPAVTVVIAALVLSRAEGALLVGLVLLGTLRTEAGRAPWRHAWSALAAMALLWSVVLAAGSRGVGDGVPPAVLLLAFVALAATVVAVLIGRVRWQVRQRVPFVVGALLWVATFLLISRGRVVFVDSAVANIGGGAGGWGVLGPLLLLAAIAAVALTVGRDDLDTASARWLLIGFIPVTMLAKLGDGLESDGATLMSLLTGGGRVGWGDSVNRMWTHAVLVVLFLLQRVPREMSSPRGARPRTTARTLVVRVSGAAVLLALATWTAAQWQPDFVPGTATEEEFVLRGVAGEAPVGELVDGSEVRQSLELPLGELPQGVTVTAICADIPFVTFGRVNDGTVMVELRVGDRAETRSIEAGRLVDWEVTRTCLTVDPSDDHAALAADGLVVVVRGSGATAGSAASVLLTQPSGFGALFTTVGSNGARIERRVAPLRADVAVVADVPIDLLSDPLRRSVLLVPWMALGIVMLLVAISLREDLLHRGRDRGSDLRHRVRDAPGRAD